MPVEHSRACFLLPFTRGVHTTCFSRSDLCINKPDGLTHEVIKTVDVKLAEAAATER